MRTATLSKAATVAVVLLAAASAGVAQEAGSAEDASPEKLWEDFIHYIKVARPNIARSYGQALLDSGTDAQAIYELSVATPGSRTTLARGEQLEGLSDVIARVRERIETGYQAKRSDPEEIARAIELLGGTLRGYQMGAERLRRSGEYALPQLVQTLSDPRKPQMLKERIITVLPTLGREAVRGLSAALQADDAMLVEIMAGALGDIGYGHAAPRLREVLTREELPERTRRVARAALISCAGEPAVDKGPAELFYRYAGQYYYEADSLRADERFGEANLWYWNGELGLVFTPCPIEIFYDVYTMRFCRLALSHDATFSPAVGLWVAADLRKEANLPEQATDPTRGENQPSAEYYARAAGAGYLQQVLERGLEDRDTPVAMGAIRALADTAGAESLVRPVEGGAQPLVEALSYPDRRVRFLSAVSLAEALPQEEFTGYSMVLWTLNEALRQTGQQRALLIVSDETLRNRLKSALRRAEFEVLDEPDPVAALSGARASAGVDVAVLARSPDPVDVVRQLRAEGAFSALPVVVARDTTRTAELAETDGRVVVVPADADDSAVADAVDRAVRGGGGEPMYADEAESWAILAARAIEKLGMTGNPVLDVTRTQPALAGAIDSGTDDVKVAAARALAAMDDAAAQQAVARLALDASASEEVRIRAFENLSASLRRFGNVLTGEHASAVVEVVGSQASFDLRRAASQALGAMNLPSEEIKDLILRTGGAAVAE
jgi:hypothetical protein